MSFSSFVDGVVKEASSLFERKAKQFAPNRHLRESIRSIWNKSGQNSYSITTSASGPDAAAREFGSGIHATRGPKSKYIIAPITKKYLAFPWDVVHPFPVYQGKAVINRFWQPRDMRNKTVKHPGVEAANAGEGYLNPAADETIRFLKKQILAQGKVEIVKELQIAAKGTQK